ncbi:MAG: Stk1 family PASTA domain-containing Ser/Thr kinase [Lachnospiraceae bacterium]|nr:Stk1 family PASTA domain-containing Ser/Thr kinase [Lachnospiraceae bacterium]
MIKAGTMIEDRYEIIELIGTGGMSDVYKAKCHKLNRFVAVKVLKQEFSENTDFVTKFRTEARAAAGLEHPNIVNVYDVGEQDGMYYIIMELVEGITLKRYIEKKARLSVKEAVSIAIQISMGIEAAHNKQIIHRDIKPQNIIISKEGKVKVTDFGIAKAATSNTITSNVMGSVHYTSPEQARGGFSDEKSDIYSLGITLFEMLTGRVPFNGETTVAIAIKHIQEEMPSPRNYIPEIPISVEQIVLKCTQKSPDRRYQKIADLIEDLKKSLISPDENFVKIESIDRDGATRTVTDEERVMIKQGATGRNDLEQISAAATAGSGNSTSDKISGGLLKEEYVNVQRRPREDASGAQRKREGEAGHVQRREPEGNAERVRKSNPENVRRNASPSRKSSQEEIRRKQAAAAKRTKEERYDDDYDPVMDKVKTIIIIVIAVIIGCIILYFAGLVAGVFGNGRKNPEEESDYSEEVSEERSETSSGQGKEGLVPKVEGLSEAEATAMLENEYYVVVKQSEFSEEVQKGYVISQTPLAKSNLKRGEEVTIVISLGSQTSDLVMPDLTNMTEENAKATLTAMGLVCSSVSEAYDDVVPAGLVCYQSYTKDSSVKKGTEVDIKLSMGPEPRYYDCNISVDAPPKYVGGNANVVLKAQDGKELFNTTTTSFPVNINLSQIYAVPRGIVYITYTVYIQEEVPDGMGGVTVQNVPAEDTYSYEVTFN